MGINIRTTPVKDTFSNPKEADYTKLSKEELDSYFNEQSKWGNKYLKQTYSVSDIHDYRDVPGWINDADWLYERIISECDDGDHLIEIGTFFGQSACRMGELIRESGKNIKFDTIDTFEQIEPSMKAGFHPPQFRKYKESEQLNTSPMSSVVQMHLNLLDLSDYVNIVICDSRLAHKLYDDNSLKMVYLDGNHEYDTIKQDLNNYWKKIKTGGFLVGDDFGYTDVEMAVIDFLNENEISFDNFDSYDFSFIIKK